jgi:hypothetical protein
VRFHWHHVALIWASPELLWVLVYGPWQPSDSAREEDQRLWACMLLRFGCPHSPRLPITVVFFVCIFFPEWISAVGIQIFWLLQPSSLRLLYGLSTIQESWLGSLLLRRSLCSLLSLFALLCYSVTSLL